MIGLRATAPKPAIEERMVDAVAAGEDHRALAAAVEGGKQIPPLLRREPQSALAGQSSGLSVSPAPRRARLTIPRVLRGIFRKRRDLLHLLFQMFECSRPRPAARPSNIRHFVPQPRKHADVAGGSV
jgi:hypothetical protein